MTTPTNPTNSPLTSSEVVGGEVVGGEVVTEHLHSERVEGVATGTVMEPVDVIAAAVLATPGVHSLHAGVAGSAATFLPGRRVAGIAIRPSGTQVAIVVNFGADVRAVAGAVHAAITALGPIAVGPVTVHVGDIAEPTP